jgi:hypothetical protein
LYTFLPRAEKLCVVFLSSHSIHHPDQLWIETLARATLFGFEVRVLELDYPTTICPHICNVLGAVVGVANNFLPRLGEFRLPFAVPFCFGFPPRVAVVTSRVSPMPNPDFSALGNQRVIASLALACKIRPGFLALPLDEREFHIDPSGEAIS